MGVVTRCHIEDYKRDGTVLIEGAFKEWVAPLTNDIERVLELSRKPGFNPKPIGYQNALTVNEDFGGGIIALGMVPLSDAMKDWQWNSLAGEIVADVMESDAVRYWIDATFWKRGSSETESTPWHNDVCTWPFWGDQMVILWVALSDVDMDNAPLRTLVGSHLGHQRYYSWMSPQGVSPPPIYRPWDELMARATAADANVKCWPLKQGDCLLVHPGTIHSSLPRRAGAGRRLAFSTRWLGDDVLWQPDVLTARLTDTLTDHPSMKKDGPPPDHFFPVVWRRGQGLQQRPAA